MCKGAGVGKANVPVDFPRSNWPEVPIGPWEVRYGLVAVWLMQDGYYDRNPGSRTDLKWKFRHNFDPKGGVNPYQ